MIWKRMTAALLELSCVCGTWRGTLAADARTGQRGTCYCDDCQAYARYLGRDDTMNAVCGTEVIQTWPAQLTVRAGAGELRLMRLTPKGLHRWYLGCCRSPLANTLRSARVPFVGVMARRVIDYGALESIFGPAVGVQGRFAPGGCPPGVLPSANLSVISGAASVLARGFWRNAHRPSPFFGEDGKAVVVAEILKSD